MPKRVYYPPAYRRYRQSHTSISICVSRDYKKRLEVLKGKKSYATFLKNLIDKYYEEVGQGVETVIEKAREQVREQEDNFSIPCFICGKPMKFSSRDDNWPEVKKMLHKALRNWKHGDCTYKVEGSKIRIVTSSDSATTDQQEQQQQKQK